MKYLIPIVLLSPYFLWILFAPDLNLSAEKFSFFYPLAKGFCQAFLSSALAMGLGLIFSLSLFTSVATKRLAIVEWSLLAPNFIPPLFIVMSVLSFSQAFNIPHQGFGWVVLVHGLMNAGIFAVAFHRLVAQRLAPYMDVSSVFGLSRYAILRRVILPLSIKPLAYTFVFVFGLCVVSFSIPLILGGPGITSMEIHIYRLIRTQGDWGSALLFSLIQSAFVFLMASLLIMTQPPSEDRPLKRGNVPKGWVGLAFLPLLFFSIFWVKDIVISLSHVLSIASTFSNPSYWLATINSVLVSAFVFFFVLGAAFLVVTQSPSSGVEGFFRGYMAPSIAVLGFSLSLVPGQSEIFQILKTSFAFFLLVFPILFRWMAFEEWVRLKPQISMALIYGASRWRIGTRVLWPQMQLVCLKMALMGAVWSIGDFGVSSFFFQGDRTLALKVTSALNSYDLNLAYILGALIFVLGAGMYLLGQRGIRYVGE